MKRLSVIYAAAAFLLASCENPLEYRPADRSDELVVNALMEAGDGPHEVHVAVSTTTRVRPVSTAAVRCFVNGTQVASSSVLKDGALSFNASFATGDEVRLELEADGKFRAGSRMTVPAPAALVKVDTARVMRKGADDDEPQEYWRFGIEMRDAGRGEDYYALAIELVIETELYHDGVLTGGNTYVTGCTLDTDSDIVLGDGHLGGGGDSLIEVGTPNLNGVFSDSRFNGGSVTLHPFVPAYKFEPFYPGGTVDEMRVRSWARVRISSISQRHYYYLKALNILYGGSSDFALEDVSIPDNIDGGIGFTGIANSTEMLVPLLQYSVFY